jgi:hypothetical protein
MIAPSAFSSTSLVPRVSHSSSNVVGKSVTKHFQASRQSIPVTMRLATPFAHPERINCGHDLQRASNHPVIDAL